MTKKLKENNFHIHADATTHELQELYTSSLNNISVRNKFALRVIYPLYYLSSFFETISSFGDYILEFDMIEGGADLFVIL